MKPDEVTLRLLKEALERWQKPGKEKCFWDSIPPEDRNKPMGLSCPCKKCTPYC